MLSARPGGGELVGDLPDRGERGVERCRRRRRRGGRRRCRGARRARPRPSRGGSRRSSLCDEGVDVVDERGSPRRRARRAAARAPRPRAPRSRRRAAARRRRRCRRSRATPWCWRGRRRGWSTSCACGRLVDDRRGPRRGCAASSAGASLDAARSRRCCRRSASSAPRFSGAARTRSVGDERVDVGEQRRRRSRTTSSSGRSATRCSTPSAEVATPETSEGTLGSTRVRLGVAVERGRRGVRHLDEVDVERLREQADGREPGAQALRDLRSRRSSASAAARSSVVVGDAEAAAARARAWSRRVTRCGWPSSSTIAACIERDLADPDAAELDRRARLQPADRAVEVGVDEQPLAGRVVEEVLRGRRLSEG